MESTTRPAWRHSPFADITLGLATLPAELHEILACAFAWDGRQSAEFKAGQLLASAIWNGALLDCGAWSNWFESFSDPRVSGHSTWLDLSTCAEGQRQNRKENRWFADPITKELLISARTSASGCSASSPRESLLHFLQSSGIIDARSEDHVTTFNEWAKMRWRLQLPPLLMDHALGRLPCFSLDNDRWSHLFGGPAPAKKIPNKSNDPTWTSVKKLWPELDELFEQVADAHNIGALKGTQAKNVLADRLMTLRTRRQSQGKNQLAAWCTDQLRDRRGRTDQKGFARSTVKDRLRAVLAGIYPETHRQSDFALSAAQVHRDASTLLESLESEWKIKEVLGASESLIGYLDSIERLEDREPGSRPKPGKIHRPTAVDANLVSPSDFTKAVAYARTLSDNGETALKLILAYRAGLRIDEIVGLQSHDFLMAPGIFELHLNHNAKRRLKTFSSRRILPLHLLLTPCERTALEHHIRQRKLQAELQQQEVLCFGPPRACRALSLSTKDLEDALNAGRNGTFEFAHLRHSFASYLLTTLLMPGPEADAHIPVVLGEVINWARRQAIADGLLGCDRLGQSSLHAVSALMGHTGLFRTLESYQHLLGLTLAQYTARAADMAATPSKPLALQPEEIDNLRPASDAPFLPLGAEHAIDNASQGGVFEKSPRPDWSTVLAIVTSGRRSAELKRSIGLSTRAAGRWNRSYEEIRQHCFDKRSSKHISEPEGAHALYLLNKMWGKLPPTLSPRQRELVQYFLCAFDAKNSLIHYPSAQDAVEFRSFLESIGVRRRAVLIYERACHRSGMDRMDRRLALRRGTLGRSWEEMIEYEEMAGPTRTVFMLAHVYKDGKWPFQYRRTYRALNYAVRFALMLLAITDDIPIGPISKARPTRDN